MRRVLFILTAILLFAVSVSAQCVKVQDVTARGGKIITSGATSTTSAYVVYPGATVSVFQTSTTTPLTVYSDSACSVVKSNPMTASSSDASFFFYIKDVARADIRISGTGVTSQFTKSDYVIPGLGAASLIGSATLNAGTVTVSTTIVTSTSRIQLTGQDDNVSGSLRVSSIVNGTSFTITSSNLADSGTVFWSVYKP